MSFVTTRPAALTAAAGALQIAGSSMAAQNAAAAAPTTGVVPAAADEVSALQAAQFAAYGTWYQQVSAQAAAIHQMLVNTLGSSAGRMRRPRPRTAPRPVRQRCRDSSAGWLGRDRPHRGHWAFSVR
ncbi:PE family protein PE13 [Mycobacterium pseudokansasii]|uniref:PE family protein PE13 n=1 Tax=Mycobacterium pseudokansasii TaxID=2341080 RepID=A0A498QPZ6_9MYCO|nr:PE family protein PE13 [Mycobacterium pseudokansasii]VAZ94837.1 PE family protein PE13 [Mycobacterium pseudokansasii]VBA50039.1 PE family protein PE13 [Mycobacterium pseudokansasii]